MTEPFRTFQIITDIQGVSAILSPNTGIVDWAQVARSYGEDFKVAGGDIHTNYEVRVYKSYTYRHLEHSMH